VPTAPFINLQADARGMDRIPAVSIMRGGAVVRKGGGYEYAGRPAEIIEKLGKDFERVLLVDIDALEGREPQLALVQELSEGDAELWLDTGAQCAGDLVHPFVAGATTVVVGTKSMRCLDAYGQIYKVSGDVVPSLDFRGDELVWAGGEAPDLDGLMAHLKDLGFARLVVADLGRGAGEPMREGRVRMAVQMGFDVFAAGGVTDADVPALEALGVKGAILDLRSLIGKGE
jgi:uncharacterized protein related to proFAR isomerase